MRARSRAVPFGQSHSVTLVDCLTLRISHRIIAEEEVTIAEEEVTGAAEDMRHAIRRFRETSILVPNEVGIGIAPDNPLARQFRGEAEQTNQLIAAVANEVQRVVAELPMKVK